MILFSTALLALVASATASPNLQAKLETILARAGGRASAAVTLVETGAGATVQDAVPIPLYSVAKLPIAIAVLAEVQAGRLRLEHRVRISRADVQPGAPSNTARWQKLPIELTIRELLALSIIESDNTSSVRLIDLMAGPAGIARRLKAMKIVGIDVHGSRHDAGFWSGNRGSAAALSALLARLARGELLADEERRVLLDLMSRATTGTRRLRAGVPASTAVADKTGTAADGAATHDVGLITLPDGRHLAVAVLIAGSPLPPARQEDLIAEVGRTAYQAFAGTQPR